MNTEVLTEKKSILPEILTYKNVRSYLLTALFVALDVAVPWIFHQFHLAGPTFLPMHIFVLLAGLLYGWRAGLFVGLFTPVISHYVSGMPLLAVLPQIIVELCFYGVLSGLLREKTRLHSFWALVGAMAGGRLALFIYVSIASLFTGVSSPIGAETGPLAVMWSTVRQGWPGVVIQLILIPLIILIWQKVNERKQN